MSNMEKSSCFWNALALNRSNMHSTLPCEGIYTLYILITLSLRPSTYLELGDSSVVPLVLDCSEPRPVPAVDLAHSLRRSNHGLLAKQPLLEMAATDPFSDH